VTAGELGRAADLHGTHLQTDVARILQAVAPLIFSAALTAWGLSAIWLTAGIGVASLIDLQVLWQT